LLRFAYYRIELHGAETLRHNFGRAQCGHLRQYSTVQ
jgi:hypothetical protein